MGTVLKCLMDINGFINLIKNKTCFKDQGSSMDLILTSRTYSFDNSSLHEISLSDHHRLIYKILKKCIIKISKAGSRLFHYRNYTNFHFFVFKTDLNNTSRCCPSSYNDFDQIFTSVLNHHALKKKKVMRGNHNPHVNKEIRKAIMLR